MNKPSRRNMPDHTDPQALAGLRHRLALRAQSGIDTARAEGDHHRAETIAADWHRSREASAGRTARDHAASVAGVPLCERVGLGPDAISIPISRGESRAS
jgi:hypothetical protein